VRVRFEHSAGGVVVRTEEGQAEVVLASRRTRRGSLAWGLPKGQVETNEDPSQAAIREVREETGFDAEIRAPLGDISYFYVWEGERRRKKVTFFLMDVVGGDASLHDHEMEEVRWFPLTEALHVASYSSERDILKRAATALEASA
jgi:8-oxo-dGTP pyrophosphatase MutT (NUDIX family)